jgi:hypothetical protein
MYKKEVQCTLDYPGADYSVCGLSVHDSFCNLPSTCFIKLRTINRLYTQNIWFIKTDKSLCDSFPGAQAITQEVCEKSTFLSLLKERSVYIK